MSFRSARALLVSALTLGAVVPVLVLAACNSGPCGCGGCTPAAVPAYPAGGAQSASAPYSAPAHSAPASAGPVVQASAFEVQAARGQALFGRYCASCHGDQGQGSQGAPALAGPGALPLTRPGAKFRTGAFHTAGDVARFVIPNMPPTGPKPSPEEDLAILAFALKANGITRTDAVAEGDLDSIVLHP